jgi:DNA-binding XRE family transcriptional regulator
MAERRRFHSEALQYLWDRSIGTDPVRIAEFEQNLVNMEVAQRIYDLRTKAGLTQRELAKKVGTTASAICRLEDADYEGHSLSMMKRIAEALNKRVEIRFVPIRKLARASGSGVKRKAG